MCGRVVRPLFLIPMWEVLKEFLRFLRQEKKWWLMPIVFLLLLLGIFLVFSASSPLAPLLYPLF
jgi:hypothetical protein